MGVAAALLSPRKLIAMSAHSIELSKKGFMPLFTVMAALGNNYAIADSIVNQNCMHVI